MATRLPLVGVGLVALAVTVVAQTPRSPAIEVSSVRPSANSAPLSILIEPGGRFVATSNPVRILLSLAFGQPGFGLRRDQMVEVPDWVDTARFDTVIMAENPADLPVRNALRSPELAAFLRVVLADRFKLAAHMEKREHPVYALVTSRAGRLGPDIRPSSVDCATETCGIKPSRECPRPNCINDIGVTLDTFASDVNRLGAGLDRPVVNETGLDGRFDLLVRWLMQPSAAARAAGAPAFPTADEVSFFSAIQDHLGLKLNAKTAPVDVLVIDHIERPTED